MPQTIDSTGNKRNKTKHATVTINTPLFDIESGENRPILPQKNYFFI